MMTELKNTPRVEIIILNYNGREDTRECLHSLESLDYPNYHITIIDNGSQDGLGELVKRDFPQVRYIYSPVNLRFAGGNNLAIKQAMAEGFDYVLLLNNDTVVDRSFLKFLVEAIQASGEFGLGAPKMYYFNPTDVIWFAGGMIDIKRAYLRHFGIGQKDDGQFDKVKEVSFLNGACLLIKAEVVAKIGMLDEDYFLYGEDVDFCLRARKAGYRLVYEPRAKIWHKISRSTPQLRKLVYRYKSWFTLMRKHSPIYWRPVQIANLLFEFIPLVVTFLKRKAKFARQAD